MGFGAAPVCSETFTMAEDPKASAVGEKDLKPLLHTRGLHTFAVVETGMGIKFEKTCSGQSFGNEHPWREQHHLKVPFDRQVGPKTNDMLIAIDVYHQLCCW